MISSEMAAARLKGKEIFMLSSQSRYRDKMGAILLQEFHRNASRRPSYSIKLGAEKILFLVLQEKNNQALKGVKR